MVKYHIGIVFEKPSSGTSSDVTWVCNRRIIEYWDAVAIAKRVANKLGLRKRPRKLVWTPKTPDRWMDYPAVTITEYE